MILLVGGGGAVLVIRALLQTLRPQLRDIAPERRKPVAISFTLSCLGICAATAVFFILGAHAGS